MPVEIGAYSWIGASTVILCGTKTGNYSVVGAGSLVNADIPANTLACGVPAKVLKRKHLNSMNLRNFIINGHRKILTSCDGKKSLLVPEPQLLLLRLTLKPLIIRYAKGKDF